MKKVNLIYFIIFLFLLVSKLGIAQYSFARRYNTFFEKDQVIGCQVLSSGYAILGHINPCGLCTKGLYYFLLDTMGNIIVEKTFALNYDAMGKILHKSIGDTLIISGVIDNTNQPVYDIFIAKIDKDGGLIWKKQFVSDSLYNHISPQSICNTIDSGYFVLYLGAAKGIRFMKLNSNGDSLYTKKIGLPFHGGTSMTELHDNGFAMLGTRFISGILAYTMLRLDLNGDTLWTIDLPRDTIRFLSKIIETKDHGFVLLGDLRDSLNHNPNCLFKFDSAGTFLWSKPLYTPNIQNSYAIQNCSDGGFIVAGITIDPAHQFNYSFLYRTDSNGDSLWFKEYETMFHSGFSDVKQTPDKGFLAVGGIEGKPFQPGDIFVVKTDSIGNVSSTLGIKKYQLNHELHIFPNPATNFFTILLPLEEIVSSISIYNAMGSKIFEETSIHQNNITIDVSGYAKGIYFISVIEGEKVYKNKLIVE